MSQIHLGNNLPSKEMFLLLALGRKLGHSGEEKKKPFLGGSPCSSEKEGRNKEKREAR